MRTALFSEAYSPMVNGVVVAVATLRQELIRQNHQVRVFVPSYPGYTDTVEGVVRCPSLSFPSDPRYPVGIPVISPRLWRALREFRPEVIHTHSLFGMGRVAARAARRLKIPLVFTYHTLLEEYTHYIPLPQPFMRWLARRESRRFADNATRVIAPGEAARDALLRYGVRSPIDVIPTGVDLSLAAADHASPRCDWPLPEHAQVIAFTGRIAREKNTDLLVESFAAVAKDHPHAHLLMIGAGPWQQQVRQQADALGVGRRMHMTGFVARELVFEFLKRCHIFAFPSVTDTQGIAVLEAMACGLPSVAADSAAVSGVLCHGQEGLVVAPRPGEFAAALARLLESPALCAELGERARQRAVSLSAAECAKRVLSVYAKAQADHLAAAPPSARPTPCRQVSDTRK